MERRIRISSLQQQNKLLWVAKRAQRRNSMTLTAFEKKSELRDLNLAVPLKIKTALIF